MSPRSFLCIGPPLSRERPSRVVREGGREQGYVFARKPFGIGMSPLFLRARKMTFHQRAR